MKLIGFIVVFIFQNSVSKKVEVDSTPSSRTESQVPSPQSVAGDIVVEDASIKEEPKVFPFKNTSYDAKRSTKKKISKGLKQILSLERSQAWSEDTVLYTHIEAPPSFKPAKKYSDLSGVPAKYTDPQTQLRYSFAEEFETIRTLPSDIVAGYLGLRKAFNPVG